MKFLSPIDLSNQQLKNLADPSVGTDGVNLQTMQAYLNGLAWKAPVRAASTANVNVASPGASIDGVTLAANDRVLLKNQTAGAENGIWVWSAAASALTRAVDADSQAELRSATVKVNEGTTNADKTFTQTVDTITVGTTALTWVEASAGVTYTAGNGISLSGNAITAVAAASGGISVVSGGIQLDTAVAVRKFAANIGNGSLTSIAVAHNLGTRDITWNVYDATTFADVFVDAVRTDANTLTLTFATAPASNAYRVVVHA